jgi:integrase/recombinase XerD
MSRKPRMHLPLDEWPAEDGIRWEAAFKTGNRFDESGPGAHLAESTRRMARESYARFLWFISTYRADLMRLLPDARIDRLIVADYVAWRRKSCGDVTVAIDLDHLRGALKLICPGVDWSWLLSIRKRIAAAAPRRHPRCHLVTSERLYALGLKLMDGAVTDADAATRISKAHAFQYRDGLIVAFLALIPLRSRTLVAMHVDPRRRKARRRPGGRHESQGDRAGTGRFAAGLADGRRQPDGCGAAGAAEGATAGRVSW